VRQKIADARLRKPVHHRLHSTVRHVECHDALCSVNGHWLMAGGVDEMPHQGSIFQVNDKPHDHASTPTGTAPLPMSSFICSAVSRINPTAAHVRSKTRKHASVTPICAA
jgi:hypothetical protein